MENVNWAVQLEKIFPPFFRALLNLKFVEFKLLAILVRNEIP